MGWLGDTFKSLLGGETYHVVEVPPIRIVPSQLLQVVDLRALTDPAVALGRGMRVAVEMVRTQPVPHSRGFIFAPAVTTALLDLDRARLVDFAKATRAHLPRRGRADSPDLVERGRGEVCVLVEPERLVSAGSVLAHVGLASAPQTGLGSANILEKIGAPITKGFEIPLPEFVPDIVSVEGVPGIAMRWDSHVLVDLRRLAQHGDLALGVPFIAAKIALKGLRPAHLRTWILASWMLGTDPTETLRSATPFAKEAIAECRPLERDRVAFDGEPTPELVRWVEDLGLRVLTSPFKLTESLRMSYPELAQNLMMDHAVRGR